MRFNAQLKIRECLNDVRVYNLGLSYK